MLGHLIRNCSAIVRLTLVKADLIPQLIVNSHPQSISFAEKADIHEYLLQSIIDCFGLTTPEFFEELEIEDPSEQQAVHETVLQQVLIPSEQYIRHLCVSRFSINDPWHSKQFKTLLARLLQICPYYQRTLEFVLHLPIFLTIPSCLTFFEDDLQIEEFLDEMAIPQRERNATRGEGRHMWMKMHRMLRMEGIEDVMEEKLQNDTHSFIGGNIVEYSITWNNLLVTITDSFLEKGQAQSDGAHTLSNGTHSTLSNCAFVLCSASDRVERSPSASSGQDVFFCTLKLAQVVSEGVFSHCDATPGEKNVYCISDHTFDNSLITPIESIPTLSYVDIQFDEEQMLAVVSVTTTEEIGGTMGVLLVPISS
ncbi:hypothetical protein BLNAU_4801 [Blattamonas nauphoetae]|uniref:Uncharacterized protein n=1 Tax=Blattamonas nauphoetae TaxID=2049346 RepID=A0ABQ9Y975_9EUKA|nr:hypothetical protein BLNAU_4801 [Blattamonas nauphoetae]